MRLAGTIAFILGIAAAADTSRAAAPQPSSAVPAGVTVETWTVQAEGVAAQLYRPVRPGGAAVLLLTGSEGGYAPEPLARSLAEAGHVVLALAYFSGMSPEMRGLPSRLDHVPLEYFDRALDRLEAISRRPLAVIGESRGAEAALLIAARRPDIALAIAFAPTSAVWQSPGTGGRRPLQPAWAVGGRPLPYAVDIGRPGRSSEEDFAEGLRRSDATTRIPVDRIRGRVLLVAGQDDQIWPSAIMATNIAARMRLGGRHAEIAIYPHAGHLLMGPGPGEVRIVTPDFTIEFGGTEAGNLAARNAAWGRTLALLNEIAAASPVDRSPNAP